MQCVDFGLLPFHLHLILSDICHFGSNGLYLCVCVCVLLFFFWLGGLHWVFAAMPGLFICGMWLLL